MISARLMAPKSNSIDKSSRLKLKTWSPSLLSALWLPHTEIAELITTSIEIDVYVFVGLINRSTITRLSSLKVFFFYIEVVMRYILKLRVAERNY